MEREILHIPEIAQMLGRTESAIRTAVRDDAKWLPPYFKQGARLCWRTESVRRFLREYEEGEHRPVRTGRKRRQPPTLSLACRPGHAG
jgi:predicted transcriptional regulator